MTPWIRRLAWCGVLACAAPSARAAASGDAPTLPAGQGLVAGTLVLDFQGSAPEMQGALFVATSMTLTIRRVDDPDARDIRFTMSPHDWETPGMARITNVDRRLLFFRALPPGTYEITDRSASAINRTVDFRGNDQRPRFTVVAGVITYIGADVLKAHGHKDLLGANKFDSADIEIDDELDDDARQLVHARPDLGAFPIRDALNGELRPAPGVVAQAEAGGAKDDMPLRDVAAVKASAGISPAVFAKLEAFHPSTPPRASGTLLRVVQHRAVTIDGKPAAGGNTRTLEFLPDAPGYFFDSMDASTGALQWLEYLPFVMVASHTTKHTAVKFGFDRDSSSTTRLSDVKLPPFDAALTPGATWMLEAESDTSLHAENAIRAIDRSNFALMKLQCSTTDRRPATTLSPDLSGTMLTVDCHKVGQADDGTTMAYLEDYGVFVLLRQAASIAPKGTRIVSDYSVVRVELSDRVAQAPPAGPARPSFDAAKAALGRHDDATAFANFTLLAEAGDARAQTMLSAMYYQGQGTPKDKPLAVQWARAAANQGDAQGQFLLATVYAVGDLVPKDDHAAFDWYLKAAQQGHAEAQQRVGGFYADGRGVPRNEQASLDWTRQSADQGFALGEANLAILYANGIGTPRDPGQAMVWARKAAEQGDALGQSQLCKLLARGESAPRDNEQAYFWCVLAAAQGEPDATTNRGNIAQVLTAAQRASAETKAAAWKPK